MDRAFLEQLLGEGLALAEIGRRVGLHESTVGYWVKKHGLEAANCDKHAAKGAIARSDLERFVAAGRSTAQIADEFGCSKTTVRHWLREYGLRTQWAERRIASGERHPQMQLRCPRHGVTTFRLRSGGGYRCTKCRAEAVVKRRRNVKRLLVEELAVDASYATTAAV